MCWTAPDYVATDLIVQAGKIQNMRCGPCRSHVRDHFHRSSGIQVNRPPPNLVALQAFKQRFEVALAKTLVVLLIWPCEVCWFPGDI